MMRTTKEIIPVTTVPLPAIQVGLFQASIINQIHPMNDMVMMTIDEIIAEVITYPFFTGFMLYFTAL